MRIPLSSSPFPSLRRPALLKFSMEIAVYLPVLLSLALANFEVPDFPQNTDVTCSVLGHLIAQRPDLRRLLLTRWDDDSLAALPRLCHLEILICLYLKINLRTFSYQANLPSIMMRELSISSPALLSVVPQSQDRASTFQRLTTLDITGVTDVLLADALLGVGFFCAIDPATSASIFQPRGNSQTHQLRHLTQKHVALHVTNTSHDNDGPES